MKTLFKVVIAVFILAAVVVGGFFFFLDSIVKKGIETVGPEALRAEVRVGSVSVAPLSGGIRIKRLFIGNPKGFDTPSAMEFDEISVKVRLKSLIEDVVRIDDITVIAPRITYEKGGSGSNIERLSQNAEAYAGGGKKKTDGKKETGKQKKFIIKNLLIKDGKVTVAASGLKGGALTADLPEINMKNIGVKDGGATGAEVAKILIGSLNRGVTLSVGSAFSKTMENVKEGISGAGEKIKGFFK